jgi:hypothetical protein
MKHTKPMARLFVDIETVVHPDIMDFLPDVKAAANVKDPAKVAASIEEKKQALIDSAPLDPDLAKVCLISMQIGEDGDPVLALVNPKGKKTTVAKKLLANNSDVDYVHFVDEVGALELFWKYFTMCDGRAIGYNLISFDVPFLVRRSFDLGVRPPYMPNLAKYRQEPITDLYCLLYNWDWQKSHGLKYVCKRYGIEVLEPEADGSKVKDMNALDLVKYGLSDLHATVGLYKRMNGYYFNF